MKKRNVKNKKGQASTEYIVLIVVLVPIVLGLGFYLRNRMLSFTQNRVMSFLNQRFFSPSGMHRFPLKLPK